MPSEYCTLPELQLLLQRMLTRKLSEKVLHSFKVIVHASTGNSPNGWSILLQVLFLNLKN